MELNGTSVLISGGGSGLGAATARWLAHQGAKVGILDANGTAAATVADEVGGVAIEVDVTHDEQTADAVDEIAAQHGHARVVVNCAGIQRHAAVIGEHGPMPLDTFRHVVDVNLVGTFNVLRLAAYRMASLEPTSTGERGVIINIASIAAFDGQPLRSPYNASKGGVVALTLPLARELAAHAIRVMSIAPGHFATPLGAVLDEAQIASHRQSLVFPNDRLGDPREFAALVEHVCTNAMLNGETIRLDAATRMPRQ